MDDETIKEVSDYYAQDTFNRIKTFADTLETPFLVVDTAIIARKYDEIRACFPYAGVYYAVKANPAPEVITLLHDKGANFDIASTFELEKVLALGVASDRVSYGNTIKKSRDIRIFYEKGVRMFATDSEADLRNIAREAPGSRIYVRILTEGTRTADWPLSRNSAARATWRWTCWCCRAIWGWNRRIKTTCISLNGKLRSGSGSRRLNG